MPRIFNSISIFIFLLLTSTIIRAQKDQIPLEYALEQSSERQLIKIGMIKGSKPAKLKFGSFSSENILEKSTVEGDDQSELLFSFDLKDGNGNTARIEAAGNAQTSDASKETEAQNEISIYISTNIDPDDLWVLLINKSSEKKDLSLSNIFLTNGDDEIVFKTVVGMPTNKTENTAPKGIEAFMDDYPIGAMQYYSGGSFSYKKFIWISDKSTPQNQLITASVFSVLLHMGAYFEDSGFTE